MKLPPKLLLIKIRRQKFISQCYAVNSVKVHHYAMHRTNLTGSYLTVEAHMIQRTKETSTNCVKSTSPL